MKVGTVAYITFQDAVLYDGAEPAAPDHFARYWWDSRAEYWRYLGGVYRVGRRRWRILSVTASLLHDQKDGITTLHWRYPIVRMRMVYVGRGGRR